MTLTGRVLTERDEYVSGTLAELAALDAELPGGVVITIRAAQLMRLLEDEGKGSFAVIKPQGGFR
jgi:hypothetical protein